VVTFTRRVEAQVITAGVWTDISDDIARQGGDAVHHYGIDGNMPMDLTAGPGRLTFQARNDANRGRLAGRFTFGHLNCYHNWHDGTPIRVVYTYNGKQTVRWRGKVADADADPIRSVRAACTWSAAITWPTSSRRIFAPSPCRADRRRPLGLPPILDAVPTDAQPPARSLDTAVDSYTFSLDRIGESSKAASAIATWTRAASGSASSTGPARSPTSAAKRACWPRRSPRSPMMTTAAVPGLDAPSRRDGRFNVVRGTYHPKRTASTTLWQFAGSTLQQIRPGETGIEIWTPYRDSNNLDRLIGASSVTAPASGTDYISNTLSDGTGTVNTADLTVSCTGYATTAKWTLGNPSGADPCNLTTWKLRGTGIFDEGAQTVEARSTQPYGERVLTLDFPYQDSRAITQGLCDLILTQREDLQAQPRSIEFIANKRAALMQLAMDVEVGDKLTLTNAYTGLNATQVQVQRIELANDGPNLICRLGIAPTSDLSSAPTAPTGLSVTVASDTQLTIAWTITDSLSETEIYRDGVLVYTAPVGVASWVNSGLTRATNYSYTLKHIKFSLVRSAFTAPVVGRPRVSTSSVVNGTKTTLGGYEYITFLISGSYVQDVDGSVDWMAAGGGGGGAGGGDNSGAGAGGGGGGGGGVDEQLNNFEPSGSKTVVIGAGGPGATTDGTTGNSGSDGNATTYRTTIGVGRPGGGGGGVSGGSGLAGSGGAGIGGGGGSGGGAAAAAGGVGNSSTGGHGFAAGAGNSAGGGGGGGAGGNGGASTSGSGGAAGAALSTFAGSFGAGGRGGPTGGPSAGAANTGNGGEGGDSIFNGQAGGSGKFVVRYPI
jgi:hypothetical protein